MRNFAGGMTVSMIVLQKSECNGILPVKGGNTTDVSVGRCKCSGTEGGRVAGPESKSQSMLAHRSVEEFGLLSAEVAHQARVSRSVIAKCLQNRGAT